VSENPVALPAEIENPRHARAGIAKKTVLIFSPDLNFSFSLSMVLQDRYHVVTTSNSAMIESFASTYAADIAIVDAVPTEMFIRQIDAIKKLRPGLSVIMTYVYDSRDVRLDDCVRSHVDAVLYKPFEADAVLCQVERLLLD